MAKRVRADLPLGAFDALLTIVAYLAVLVLRFDGSVPHTYWRGFRDFTGAALVAHLGSNWACGLYRQMWRHASVQEARRVIAAGGLAVLVLAPVYFALDRPVPLSVALLGASVATAVMGTLRFQSRLFAVHRNRASVGARVAVIGAGEAGAAIVREMQRSPAAGLAPVVVLDDDPRKQGLSLLGVPVVGSVETFGRVVEEFDVQRAILAVPSAGQSLVRRVAGEAESAELPLQVLPGLGELVRGQVTLRDVRDLRIDDLLGRQEVKTDLEAVRRLLSGRRVMITGGGGSIGSEIARQVAACDPDALILLDNDETHLHDAASLLDQPGVVTALADVRSSDRVMRAFARYRPEIVFHAAAHKHVPLLERHPSEAALTNVLGTRNVMGAAVAMGVHRFVFVSTDKAVRPASVMGASKWLGEQMVLAKAPPGMGCVVRFGNVLGSRGSVIPTFARQIAAGGPVTVTDTRMTRYFMSIEEAVQLVLQAAVFAEGGDVFMLDMGQPINIFELAKRMIRLSGYRAGVDIPIRVVGTRDGEKLSEELRAPDEIASPTAHEAIVRLDPVRLPADVLDRSVIQVVAAAERQEDDEVFRALLGHGSGRPAAPPNEGEYEIDITEVERRIDWNRSSI